MHSELIELRRLVADDAHACTFQTFGQYRTALLKAIDAAAQAGTTAADPAVSIDYKQATELLAMFGGEPGEVTLLTGGGHSGRGLYAHYTEYPEEGAEFLGETDGEATPAASLTNPTEVSP